MPSNLLRGQVRGRVCGILTPGASPTFNGVGVTSVAQNATGDYTFTFASECKLPPTDSFFHITILGSGTNLAPEVVSAATGSLRVKTWNSAGAAVDKSIAIESVELRPAAE